MSAQYHMCTEAELLVLGAGWRGCGAAAAVARAAWPAGAAAVGVGPEWFAVECARGGPGYTCVICTQGWSVGLLLCCVDVAVMRRRLTGFLNVTDVSWQAAVCDSEEGCALLRDEAGGVSGGLPL